jgi:hypothetical protein
MNSKSNNTGAVTDGWFNVADVLDLVAQVATELVSSLLEAAPGL